jgi:hypothetical protein
MSFHFLILDNYFCPKSESENQTPKKIWPNVAASELDKPGGVGQAIGKGERELLIQS